MGESNISPTAGPRANMGCGLIYNKCCIRLQGTHITKIAFVPKHFDIKLNLRLEEIHILSNKAIL